jgi:hypothetical protein
MRDMTQVKSIVMGLGLVWFPGFVADSRFDIRVVVGELRLVGLASLVQLVGVLLLLVLRRLLGLHLGLVFFLFLVVE